MKKTLFFALAICVLLVVSACTAPQPAVTSEATEVAATEHTHIFAPATCTEPETCSCGAINGSPVGHTWSPATYEAPKTCTVCAATEGEALSLCLADFIGKTVKDVKAVYGAYDSVSGFAGSTMLSYEEKDIYFILDGYYATPADNHIVQSVMSTRLEKLVGPLYGAMSSDEVIAAVSSTVSLGQPEKYYNEMDGRYEYTLSFRYSGYQIVYTWEIDPVAYPAIYAMATKITEPPSVAPQETTEPDTSGDLTDELVAYLNTYYFEDRGWKITKAKVYNEDDKILTVELTVPDGFGFFSFDFHKETRTIQLYQDGMLKFEDVVS